MKTLKIHVLANEESSKEAKNLKNWLENDEDFDYQKINQERAELKDDEAGGVMEATLAVVLGAPAVVQLVKALQTWFTQKGQTKRGEEITVELEKPDGTKLKVNAKQLNEQSAELIRELSSLLK
jgi:ferric-dicitrate binding protein FerR (iron transport regulator)